MSKPMSLTRAKLVAKSPQDFTTEELDAALTTIVDSDRLSETQVTNLQAKIDPVLRARLHPSVPQIIADTVQNVADFAATTVQNVQSIFAPKGTK